MKDGGGGGKSRGHGAVRTRSEDEHLHVLHAASSWENFLSPVHARVVKHREVARQAGGARPA
jgi:hypothetical protein